MPGCGTHAAGAAEASYLHARAETSRKTTRVNRSAAARAANQDFGNIAVVDDSGGVVSSANPFNLNLRSIAFNPASAMAASYKLESSGYSYDADAAGAGLILAGLGDDDSREIPMRFAFPFFGASYRSIFVNSDGNLTFVSGDANSTDRSLGRMIGGQPRIAPLFTDLDPTAATHGGVRVLSEAGRFVITWDAVPVYSDYRNGQEQTFQVRLYPTGRIEFAYNGANPLDAVTGIAPGNSHGQLTLLSLRDGSSQEFTAAVADRFAEAQAIDIALVAQKFYATHEDAYDYLVIFNALRVGAGAGVVAYEVTTRNHRQGYGDQPVDTGSQYGSPSRLQSVLNLGPLTQYPIDPNAPVPLRVPSGDTTLTVLGHEAGHLFLAFASIRDPQTGAETMLGRANVHWAFNFNSEASFLEGNRIQDNGEGASPRFTTIKTVEGYSPLDQYLMGFRPPSEVPPTFVVNNANVSPVRPPQTGVNISGTRRDVTVDDIIAIDGRRIPDSTVAQRRFRFAFILIVHAGSDPTAAQLSQLDAYRTGFEDTYSRATSGRAAADTSLARAIHTTAFPATGTVAGGGGSMTISLDTPPAAPLTIFLDRQAAFAGMSASVTIPAGSTKASVSLTGLKPGVQDLVLRPSDPSYETVVTRIPVAPSNAALMLTQGPATGVFRVWDANHVPYSGVTVIASVAGVETFAASTAKSDEDGYVSFNLPLQPGANSVTATIEGAPGSALTVSVVQPVVSSVVNAASLMPGITPSAYASIFGAGLADTIGVFVNGEPADITYVTDQQVNFLVPADVNGSPAVVTVVESSVMVPDFSVAVLPVSPGIFSAQVNSGTLQVFVTGLNGTPPEVTAGGAVTPVQQVVDTQYPGMARIDAVIPPGTPAGPQAVVVTAGGVRSNSVTVQFP